MGARAQTRGPFEPRTFPPADREEHQLVEVQVVSRTKSFECIVEAHRISFITLVLSLAWFLLA